MNLWYVTYFYNTRNAHMLKSLQLWLILFHELSIAQVFTFSFMHWLFDCIWPIWFDLVWLVIFFHSACVCSRVCVIFLTCNMTWHYYFFEQTTQRSFTKWKSNTHKQRHPILFTYLNEFNIHKSNLITVNNNLVVSPPPTT